MAFELEATESGSGAEREERITSHGRVQHKSGEKKKKKKSERRKAWVSTD